MANYCYVVHKNTLSTYFTCDFPAQRVTVDKVTTWTITLTCKPMYRLSADGTMPYIQYRANSESGTIILTERFSYVDDTHCTLTTDFNGYRVRVEPSGSWTIYGIITGTATAMYAMLNHTLTNCVCDVPAGEVLAGLTTMQVSCVSGYEFEVPPYLEYRSGAVSHTVDFEQVSDTLYQLQQNLTGGVVYTVGGAAIKVTPILNKYGFISAYRLTREEVTELASKRWVEVNYTAEKYQGANVFFNANEEYIDTAKYVSSFFKLFAPITTEVKQNLMFGPYDMDMEVDLISEDNIVLDCGTINLTGQFHNAIDYKHTTLEIYLPFIGFTPLTVNDFMDKAVNLKYQINIMNGDALAILTADGSPVFSHPCNVSLKIPYQLGANEFVNTQLDPNNNFLLDTPPFVIVKVNPPTDPDTEHIPYRDTHFYAQFGTLTGYTEATEIDMTVLSEHTFITRTEIDEIVSLLESGVFL